MGLGLDREGDKQDGVIYYVGKFVSGSASGPLPERTKERERGQTIGEREESIGTTAKDPKGGGDRLGGRCEEVLRVHLRSP